MPFAANAKKRCGAKTRAGAKCPNPGMLNGRCRIHGGKTPRGIMSPKTRSGLWSQAMPKDLQGRFEAAMKDTELLSLRTSVAALEAKILTQFEDLRDNTGPDWSSVLEQVEEIADNFKTWDWTRAEKEIRSLTEMVGTRSNAEATWREIRSLMNQKAGLAMQESKRLVALEQTLTVEEVLLLATALGEIIRRHVQDNDTLRLISRDWQAVLTFGENGLAARNSGPMQPRERRD